MKGLFLLCLMSIITGLVMAQRTNPDKTPTVVETNRRRIENTEKINGDFNRLKDITSSRKATSGVPSEVPAGPPPRLTKEQAERLRPNSEDSIKYAAFLKLPRTGLFKLYPDLDCFEEYKVRTDGNCLEAMPFSSYYSFRKKNYLDKTLTQHKKLSDIGLKGNNFVTNGLLSHGIIVSLGDVPIETLSAGSEEIRFLVDYQPARDSSEAVAKIKELTRGIKDGNYEYSTTTPVLENTTYAVRVIAYRTKSNIGADIFEGDNRFDIIVVFRVVRKDSDQSLTLLWKELGRKDSPKIEPLKRGEAKES